MAAPALLALFALAALPAAGATALSLDAGLDAPLVPDAHLDVGLGGPGVVDVGLEAPLLPSVEVSVPGLAGIRTGPDSGPRSDPGFAPGPAPAPTPPTLPEATRVAAGQAAGAAAMGALAAAPALPWETLWTAVSNWAHQAREACRPGLRAAGRVLRALPFLAPLFTRVGGARLLENPVRARMHEAIAQDPGLSLQDVRDRAGAAWGTTVHHLARLERHGLVVSVRHGNHRRFFPAHTAESRQRRELSVLAHPTARRIAHHVAAHPGTDQKGICAALGLRNPAASKHLGRFESLGLVAAEAVGRRRLYQPTDLLRGVLATLESLGGIAPPAPPAPAAPPAPRVPLVEALPEAGPAGAPGIAVAT